MARHAPAPHRVRYPMPRTTTPRAPRSAGKGQAGGGRRPHVPTDPAAAAHPRQRPLPAPHLPAVRRTRKVRPCARRGHGRAPAHPARGPAPGRVEDPEPDDIYEIGIVAEVLQMLKVPDGTVRVMLEGMERARIKSYRQTEPFFPVEVEPLPDDEPQGLKAEALMRSVMTQFEQIVNTGKKSRPRPWSPSSTSRSRAIWPTTIAWHLPTLRVETKQDLLETLDAAGAAGKPRPDPQERVRDPGDPEEHPQPGRKRDGRHPARVHPARADEGHPAGTGRARRAAGRGGRIPGQDRRSRDARGRRRARRTRRWTGWKRCPTPRPKASSSAPIWTG